MRPADPVVAKLAALYVVAVDGDGDPGQAVECLAQVAVVGVGRRTPVES
jgi:hypothetical protein